MKERKRERDDRREKLWQRNDRWSRNISGFCFREKIVRNCARRTANLDRLMNSLKKCAG